MNRIDQKFIDLKKTGKPAFMPFVVAGDPDYNVSLEVVKTLCQTADFLEIGFPYSDPLADGPTIQAADMRALGSGITPDDVFHLVREIRKFSQIPIVPLVYCNLVLQRGVDKFYRDAASAGIDGVLIPDVPVEEIGSFTKAAAQHHIHQIFLVTQMTDNHRLREIIKHAKGFLYLVSILGVTGTRKHFSKDTRQFIRRVRKQTVLPLCVGFGVSTPGQFRSMVRDGADGVIVGSAIVDVIAKSLGKKNLTGELKKFVSKFKVN